MTRPPTTKATKAAPLAYETAGTGTPVVLIHGLTFDRTTWRPIVDELEGAVRTVALDMPSHGDSPGPPMAVAELGDLVHDQLATLGLTQPLVVGHSFGAAVAAAYAARYPTLGLVMVDSGPDQQGFAELVQGAAPMLRGPGFTRAWPMIESSLGLDVIPEPVQTLVRGAHRVQQEVILGYWDQILSTPPAEFQAYIDSFMSGIHVPVLAVYGRPAPDGDLRRFERIRDVRVEEYAGEGHFVHLTDVPRFAASLRRFADRCVSAA